jgi:hypothetical protein
MGKVEYACEVTSLEGFVHQVAVGYVRNHYRYYSMGYLREGAKPSVIDARIVAKYGIAVDKWERHRRKRAGLTNLQYIRHGRTYLILATAPRGDHPFFRDEVDVRDARDVPIRIGDYEIAYRGGRVWVRIERRTYLRLRAYFLENAAKRSAKELASEFRSLPFEPYRPVRFQLFGILEEVNELRKRAGGLAVVPESAVRFLRARVRPFDGESVDVG